METKLEVKFAQASEQTVWNKRIEFKRGSKLASQVGVVMEGSAVERQRLFAPNHTLRHLAQ